MSFELARNTLTKTTGKLVSPLFIFSPQSLLCILKPLSIIDIINTLVTWYQLWNYGLELIMSGLAGQILEFFAYFAQKLFPSSICRFRVIAILYVSLVVLIDQCDDLVRKFVVLFVICRTDDIQELSLIVF
jgi:hypothetical protein